MLSDGILEETLVHEASHTSLDADHAVSPQWFAAQQADNAFISTYARDNATREDIAETFLLWLAIRHRNDRIADSLRQTVLETIPNRIDYFDAQEFDLFPVVIPEKPPVWTRYAYDPEKQMLQLSWSARLGSEYAIDFSSNLTDWSPIQEHIPTSGTTAYFSLVLQTPSSPQFFRVREEKEP